MKMIRSREILAAILQIIITFCTAVLIFSFVMNITVCTDSYFTSKFPSSEVAAECDKQLEMKFGELSRESGFPSRVFMMICEDTPTVDNVNKAMEGAITSGDGSIYAKSLEEYYYNLCKDYAEGNDIKCSDESLSATAKKAAQLYCETVGVSGFENTLDKLEYVQHKVTLAQFLSFVIIIVCAFSTVLIYSRKRLSITRIMCGLSGGGLAALFTSVLMYFIKPVLSLNIEPLIYRQAFGTMASSYFVTTALVSAAVIVVPVIVSIYLEREHEKSKDKVKII